MISLRNTNGAFVHYARGPGTRHRPDRTTAHAAADEFPPRPGLKVVNNDRRTTMADVTYKTIDEMETLYHGIARRARAELGVTGWGTQVYSLPPAWDGYPDHAHGDDTEEAGQEEVYIPLAG